MVAGLRPSQYIVPFGNTEPICTPLPGHFMDIEGRVLLHQRERYQLSLTYNALHSALSLMALYQCIKFHLIFLYTVRDMLRTSFLLQK